jgi:hypothetical protein
VKHTPPVQWHSFPAAMKFPMWDGSRISVRQSTFPQGDDGMLCRRTPASLCVRSAPPAALMAFQGLPVWCTANLRQVERTGDHQLRGCTYPFPFLFRSFFVNVFNRRGVGKARTESLSIFLH